MTQLVLVLEENPEVQRVIAASLKDSNISITQESNHDFFVQQASNLKPYLIFLSNSDSEQDYKTCREIRAEADLKNTPIILLANAKDELDEVLLAELGINGFLRKPFEASKLKQQLSPFITLDENFGTGPDKDDEDFMLDMSTIDNQLKEIKQAKVSSNSTVEGEFQKMDAFEQSTNVSGIASVPASEMDSMVLENIMVAQAQPENVIGKEKLALAENEMADDSLEEISDDEIAVDVLEEIPEAELDMEDGFEFELSLDEDELEIDSEVAEKQTVPEDIASSTNGLEQLKNSGLEDQFAEIRLSENQLSESPPKDQQEEAEQQLRAGLTEIDLEQNDFEEPGDIWSNPPDLDQTLREGLTDISLDQADFQPEYPKNLASFEVKTELPVGEFDVGEDTVDMLQDMDNYELEQDISEMSLEEESSADNFLLTDSVEQEVGDDTDVEDVEEFIFETSSEEFEETFVVTKEDAEINTMVQDSLQGQQNSAESALGELEDLSEQMEALESEETEFEVEEAEFEDELAIEEFETESISAEGSPEAEEDSEEHLADFMVEELGDLLEDDDGSDAEDFSKDEIVVELEEAVIAGIDDLVEEGAEFETEEFSDISVHLGEEVFDSWGEAEDAFMGFDRETGFSENAAGQSEIDGIVFDNLDEDDEDFEKSESYRFTEKELKEIVSSSVQKALEKSIAASLVELAVSELKTQVSQMDQS